MSFRARKLQGYSLIEILVVLAVLGVLSVVGVSMLGNRRSAAVRSLLDEFEGGLNTARVAAGAGSRDVALDGWLNGTSPVIAFGDAGLTDASLQTIASGLIASPPTLPAATVQYGQTVNVAFKFLSNDVVQSRARVVPVGSSADWTTAMTATSSGAVNQDITTLPPFTTGGVMNGILIDDNNLFNPTRNSTPAGITRQVVSGSGQRFTGTFFIEIVGTSPNQGPLNGSPMGLIVMLNNGASVYKFYNPGCLEGDGKWRRI